MEDARANQNEVLRSAARNGHIEVLKLLQEWSLTAEDARARDNQAVKEAANRGHVKVLKFLFDWGLTQADLGEADVSP